MRVSVQGSGLTDRRTPPASPTEGRKPVHGRPQASSTVMGGRVGPGQLALTYPQRKEGRKRKRDRKAGWICFCSCSAAKVQGQWPLRSSWLKQHCQRTQCTRCLSGLKICRVLGVRNGRGSGATFVMRIGVSLELRCRKLVATLRCPIVHSLSRWALCLLHILLPACGDWLQLS